MKERIRHLSRCGVMLAVSAFMGKAGAQLPEYSNFHYEEAPFFLYDFVTSAAVEGGQSKLHLSMKIAYDELLFVRVEDAYRASYEVNMMVSHPDGDPVDGKIIRKDVAVNTFEETKSGTDFSIVENDFALPEGKYELLIELMDMDSKKTGRQKIEIQVPDYTKKSLDVSDLFFIDRLESDSTGKSVAVPSVMADYGIIQKSLFVSFEIYNRIPLDSVRITYYILDPREEVLREYDYYKVLKGECTVETVEIERGRLEGGKYKLEFQVGEGKSTVKRAKDFSVLWLGMPAYATDLDKAIEQMKYITKKDTVKRLKKAKKADKERLFKEFWHALDPSPNTTVNELMEAYYRRVDYANKHFGVFKEGWTTDQGMVYIVLGPPDNVERHPLESDSRPLEIWSYFNINRSLIFKDDRGFGEYRLITDWDIIRRF